MRNPLDADKQDEKGQYESDKQRQNNADIFQYLLRSAALLIDIYLFRGSMLSDFSAEQFIAACFIPFDDVEREIDQQDEYQQNKSRRDQRAFVDTAGRGVAHFQHDRRREGGDGRIERLGEISGRAADDEIHRDGFSHRPAHAENNRGQYPRFRRGEHDAEHRLIFCVSKPQRTFVIFLRGGFEAIFCQRSDRGHNHNRKDDDRRKHARARLVRGKNIPYQRHDDHKAEKADDD